MSPQSWAPAKVSKLQPVPKLLSTHPAWLPPPPDGTVELRPSRGNRVIILLASPPDRSGGLGGWQTSDRLFRRPVKWFQAPAVDTMGLTGMLDRTELSGGHDVETRLGWLYAMGLKGSEDAPPTIKVAGDVRPYDRRLTWVIQDISLGDRTMHSAGVIENQTVSIALEGFDALPLIEKASVKATRKPGSSTPKRRVIRTLKGDTLRTIAVRQLGSSSQYTKIRDWNKKFKKTDPDQPLKAGLVVVLH